MIPYPIHQRNHNFIGAEILPWLRLHFPAGSAYRGRIPVGQHHKEGAGIYEISCRNIEELQDYIPLMHISQNLDYYITANSFAGVQRVTEGVFALHNIVVDVDCHVEAGVNTTEAVAAFLWRASRDLWSDGSVPSPSSIVMTGRGVQLWWAIEPISVKVRYWYKRVQHWLIDQLQDVLDDNPEELGELSIDQAASSKLAGWFRLPLTYNTKAKRWGKLQILREQRYTLQELIDCVPEEYKPRSLFAPRRSGAALAAHDADVLRGCTSAMARRVLSLMELRSLRQASIGKEQRDLYNFVVYCSLRGEFGHDEAMERTIAFNSDFRRPMDRAELTRILSSAERKGYHLTNEWVIRALGISESEQDLIGLYPTRKKREDCRPNENRDAIRKAIREDRDARILALFESGLSRAEIARRLEISRNTVGKVVAAALAQEQLQEAVEPVATAAGAEDLPDLIVEDKPLLKNGSNKYVSYGRPVPGGLVVLPAGRSRSSPGDSS